MNRTQISTLVTAGLAVIAIGACSADGAQNGETATEDSAAEMAANGAEMEGGMDAAAPIEAACWTRAEPDELAGRPSPLDSTSVALDPGAVKVCYGSPQMRGREIMGGLVPFDRPWRLGANEATRIHMPAAGTIAGVQVDSGWYSLYTIPSADSWEIFVNGTSERWGIPISGEVTAENVGSGTVNVQSTDAPVEGLTMSLRANGSSGAILRIEWEDTRVEVPIQLTGGTA